MNRVVVTGFGAITPVGLNAQTNWESLMNVKTGVAPITLFDATGYSSRIAGEVKGFDPAKHFPVKELKRIGRFIQFALVAGSEAVGHSGLNLEQMDKTRIGACIGVGIGGLPEIQSEYLTVREKGPKRVSPFFIPSVIGNLAAGQLSLKFGLQGPNTCITTACSSSAHAIGEAFRLIQRGDQDAMLAGGAEAVVCELGVSGFCSMRALSERNEAPEKASRPFDKDRDGFVIGEGSAILVLESLASAKKRGATIFAEIVGYGLNSDAYHLTSPSPQGEGAARCMKLALADAKLNPEQ
ncbi:MAG: beta-ketoacyl-ACP synthase II, partial [Proteobacteria bacterium]|nr:beta-ketoacyl-ACP synthase II [Pseudomonadota bacterium]